jgi:hypothetical protein
MKNNLILSTHEPEANFGQDWVLFQDCVKHDFYFNSVCVNFYQFSTHVIRIVDLSFSFDQTLFDHKWDRNYPLEEKDKQYQRGGFSYYVPVEYSRHGLAVKNFDEKYAKWAVTFHGPGSFDNAKLISFLEYSLQLPGFKSRLGVKVKVQDGHITTDKTVFGIQNWGNGIFTSPSYIYSSSPFYSTEYYDPKTKKYYNLLFQVRVNPQGLVKGNKDSGIFPQTVGWKKPEIRIDPHFHNDELEWRVVEPENVKIYSILVRESDSSLKAIWNDWKKKGYY